MTKTATSLLAAMSSGLLIYINNVLVMFLPYGRVSLFIFRNRFIALCAIGVLIASVAILYSNHSVFQTALRWFFTVVFFAGVFLLSAYSGLVAFLYSLLELSANSVAENTSGMLTVSYIFVVFATSLLIALGKIISIFLRRMKATDKYINNC